MKMRPVLVLALLTALLNPFLSAAFADQDFKNVSPAELKANPQNYWARGVIFNDVMVAGPGGAPLRVENRDCTPITLKIAGTCYIEPALLPVIKELPLQQSYIFRGTVLQAKAPGSWFFGSKVYLILITGVEATVDTEKMSQNFMKMYDRVDQIPPKGSTQAMTALLLEVQTALAKYAREKEMPLEQLLGDDSESSKKAIGIIYEAIHTQETRSKTTAEEILASYILAFLRAQYQPQPAAPDVAPVLTNIPAATPINTPTSTPQEAVTPVPGPVPVIEPAPVDVTTNSATSNEPAKKSWLQRRRERQAQEAAEAAELKRIEQEKRLQEKEAERIRQEQEQQAREELQKKQQAEREEKARLAAEAKRKAAAAKREEERKAREEALKQQEAEKAEQARLAAEAEEAKLKDAELKAAEELKAREEAQRRKEVEEARLAAEANERKAAEAKREEQHNAQEEAQRLEETEQADQARLLAEKEAFEKKASMQSSEEQPQAPLPEQPADSEDLNAPVGL